MQIQDVRAIVTGGASGLGLATARMIVRGGGKAALFDINEQAGAAALHELGSAASFHKVDVTSEAAVVAGVEAAVAALGGLNAVVTCAGIGTPCRFVGKNGPMPAEFFRKVLDINLYGSFLVALQGAVRMQQNTPNAAGERGVIVMTASVAAFDGQIGQVAYSASKGAIVGMTLPMARDLASSGIRVMTIAPGIFETPLLAALPEEAKASLGKQVPFPPRLGQPSEFAQFVQQILENTMLNGETVRLDGAIRMAPR
jgi:3-hydroxyacyl-CoA dehydrogenase/3-hydroxy-2-methylbutyryl-CoA dehydrogenase